MLNVNEIAPDFQLPSLTGETYHFYSDVQTTSALLFYKFNCGTCRFAFPFLQKIYKAYGDAIHFRAIAQDPADKADGFRKDLGITIPTLLDMQPYTVSSAYGLDTVPSIFLVDPSHKIVFATYSFVKQDILNFADILAEKSGRPQIDVYGNLDVPDMKPG